MSWKILARSPYTDQLSIGFDRELFTDVAVSATFVHKDGRVRAMIGVKVSF